MSLINHYFQKPLLQKLFHRQINQICQGLLQKQIRTMNDFLKLYLFQQFQFCHCVKLALILKFYPYEFCLQF